MKDINNEDFSNYEDYAEESKSYDPAPEGPQIARLVWIIKLGLQKRFNENSIDQQKVLFGWELPNQMRVINDENEPIIVTNEYNLKLHPKSKFTIHIESWLKYHITPQFNYLRLLGQPCILNIKHEVSKSDPTQIRARVIGITPLMEGQECPPQISPYKVLLFNKWNEETFESLPVWIQNKIKASPEYAQLIAIQANDNYQKEKKSNPVKPYATITGKEIDERITEHFEDNYKQ